MSYYTKADVTGLDTAKIVRELFINSTMRRLDMPDDPTLPDTVETTVRTALKKGITNYGTMFGRAIFVHFEFDGDKTFLYGKTYDVCNGKGLFAKTIDSITQN